MTTTLLALASPPSVLDLDARLAIVDAVMTVLLDDAAVEFEIRTAHLAGADPVPDVAESVPVVPLTPTLAPAANPYDTPLAALLYRARVHIETHGWLQGGLREDEGTRRCPMGAIRIEAGGNRHLADDACVLLLDVVREDLDFDTIPQWSDAQTSATPVLHYLDRAAATAHNRGI